MGPKFRAQLLQTASEIVSKGIVDPVIFELVGIFEEGIGCDRISDMVCRILSDDFYKYTSRVLRKCGFEKPEIEYKGEKLVIFKNPKRNEPILLAPKDVLRDLPIANDWSDISYVCHRNRILREKINGIIGHEWDKKTKGAKKTEIKNFFINHPDFFKTFIHEYKSAEPEKYDFESDPSGEANWFRASKEYTKDFPLKLSLPDHPTINDLESVIKKICDKFAHLIEYNGLWSLLYRENDKPKHESASQLLFYAVSSIYCEESNLALSREANGGRGPVDFKIASGKTNYVVDVKLSTNSHILQSYKVQVPIYQKSESSYRGIILVLKVKENSTPLTSLLNLKESDLEAGVEGPDVIVVDALPKDSASIARYV
jgi:hypothetical protein